MNRTPSIKTLSAVFPDPKAAKRVLQMSRAELCALPQCEAALREYYNPPMTSELRLRVLNSMAETYGVESFELPDGTWAEFLNAGDAYATTLLRVRGHYRVGCWADLAELRR